MTAPDRAVVLYQPNGRPLEVLRDDARAFTPPTYYSGATRTGLGTSGGTSLQVLVSEMKSWQAMAARAIAKRIGSLQLEVVARRRIRAGTVEEEVLDNHPLADLLAQPNPLLTIRQLLLLVSYWMTQAGSAYLLKVTDGLGVVRELWPMAPDRVEVLVDDANPLVGYVFWGDGGNVEYAPDEVVRVWDPNPASLWEGLGTLAPQAVAYDASQFAEQTVREHFRNDATPKFALLADETAKLPAGAERDAFDADWTNRYHARRGRSRGLPAFVPPGFTVHEFGGLEQLPVDLLAHYRDQLLMANGVPRSILGDVVDANRAAAETNQFVFDLHTVEPQAALIADAFTLNLARDFDRRLSVRFADFVSQDKMHELAREAQDLATKVRSINKVLTDRGEDEVAWGELPVGTFGDVPYTGEEPEPPEMDDEGALMAAEVDDGEPEDEMPDEPRSRSVRAAFFAPAAEWRRLLAREREFVPLLSGAMRRVFALQREEILTSLAAILSARQRQERVTLDDLFGDRWARTFRAIVEPVRRKLFLTVGNLVVRNLGAAEFLFDPAALRVLERQGADLVRHVNATTRGRLKTALVEGLDAGEGEREIAGRVREVFRGRRDNARTIARTEVLRAASSASLEGYRQSGVVEEKRWGTSQDDRVRDSHDPVDGQTVGLADAFVLGDGERAEAPGVGVGGAPLSPGNSINCRCFVVPVVD